MILDTTTPIRDRVAHTYPSADINSDFESRRRELAEERYREPVEFVPAVGYIALSELHKYMPLENTESDPVN